jgi:hypothetical protein
MWRESVRYGTSAKFLQTGPWLASPALTPGFHLRTLRRHCTDVWYQAFSLHLCKNAHTRLRQV